MKSLVMRCHQRTFASSLLSPNVTHYVRPSILDVNLHAHVNQQAKLWFCVFNICF
jgi:hypothetical protein